MFEKFSPEPNILLIDKPVGPTSFGVIGFLRKQMNIRKIGHAGTLDPLASGLLVIAYERVGTKKLTNFIKLPKTYRTHVLLGTQTDSGDMEGGIVKQEKWNGAIPVKRSFWRGVAGAAAKFVGKEIEGGAAPATPAQIAGKLSQCIGTHKFPVPIYSAIKVDGRPLYWYARNNQEPPRIPIKEMTITELEFHGMVEYPEGPALDITVSVTSGTYVRTLGEYIASQLGTIGVLKMLRRTKIDDWKVEDALQLGYTDGVIHLQNIS